MSASSGVFRLISRATLPGYSFSPMVLLLSRLIYSTPTFAFTPVIVRHPMVSNNVRLRSKLDKSSLFIFRRCYLTCGSRRTRNGLSSHQESQSMSFTDPHQVHFSSADLFNTSRFVPAFVRTADLGTRIENELIKRSCCSNYVEGDKPRLPIPKSFLDTNYCLFVEFPPLGG